jgi:Putative Flp pilus-assembly TadE/G-like/von Willebrand factor type A domain
VHAAPLTGSRQARAESGQVIVLVAVALAVLLGMAALTIDVGFAYYAQRSLQASADAAALAAAQELPVGGNADAVARRYAASAGGKNQRENVPGVVTEVQTKCVVSVGPCDPVNAVVVTQHAEVGTNFAGILGLDKFTVRAKATACAPCGSRPVDVMLVLDRTGSMCEDHWGRADPTCKDMKNAKAGLKAFLMGMDASIDRVGLAVFPPATSDSARCSSPITGNYNVASNPYVVVGLSSDYKLGGSLNNTSKLVSTVNCLQANGMTAYATAMERARAELAARGRSNAEHVIVFFSDGAANFGPTYYSSTSDYRMRPCRQGVTSSAAVKSAGTRVFVIGYDLDALDGGANECLAYTGRDESPTITAYSALQQMASDSGHFYAEPAAGDLVSVYQRIAVRVAGVRLIDDDAR